MAYFVTGATGFIGRHLVERLLERVAEQAVAEVVPVGLSHHPHQRGVALLAAERREVVLADERVTGQTQQGQVERLVNVPGDPGQERVGHRPVEHRVAVGGARERVQAQLRRAPTQRRAGRQRDRDPEEDIEAAGAVDGGRARRERRRQSTNS